MKTVTLDVQSLEDSLRDVAMAAKNRKAAASARISFTSVETLWQVLTTRRWEIIKVMAGAGALSIREIARRVGRDIKAVHGDVQALLKAGVLSRSPAGQAIFPYEAVHVDFVLHAVA